MDMPSKHQTDVMMARFREVTGSLRYIDERLSIDTLEKWERKEYEEVRAQNAAKMNELKDVLVNIHKIPEDALRCYEPIKPAH